MAAAPDTLNLSLLARQYVANGWALVPVAPGTKGPNTPGWNQLENCVTTVADCRRIRGNVGLAHAFSGTCVLDLDDFEKGEEWLQAKGVRLSEFWDAIDAVKINSGRLNRGKLLFKLPPGVAPLASISVADDKLEFRCAAANGRTFQDLLPPSIHPDTHEPYQWVFDPLVGSWESPPELPAALLRVWQNELRPVEREAPSKEEKTPLGLSKERIRKLIYQEDPDAYNNWIDVGFAVHHEMRGADVGYELWDEWSSTGADYKGADETAYKWSTFGKNENGLKKTIRSIMATHGVHCEEDFDNLDAPEVVQAVRETKFAVRSAGEFAAGPPQPWIIKGVLPKAQIGMIFGESTAGKSFVAMDMLISIARGENWRGMRTKQLRTVMIIAEGAGGAKSRVRAYEQHHGVDLNDYPFGIIQDRPDLFGKTDYKRIIRQIQEWGGADVIAVDTLAQSSAGANENSGEDMGLVLEHCHKLSVDTGAMVLLVHHAGKDVAKGARGWSGLKAAMDVEIEVSRSLLHGRMIKLSKSKDGEEGQPMGFKLNVVQIGEDEDGDPITSCVIEHSDKVVVAASPKDGLKAEHQIILGIMARAADIEAAMRMDDIRRAAVLEMEQKGKVDNRMRDAGKAIEKLESLGYLAKDEKDCYFLARTS
jgi:hypothetical protein